MKTLVLKILGVPALRPVEDTARARIKHAMHWLVFALFSAFMILQFFPRIVFHHQLVAHGITVHSRHPLPPQADAVLARASALVAASELAVPGRVPKVFVADEPWVYWLFRPFKSSFAVSAPFTNNIFVAHGDFATDIARSRNSKFNTRALSAVIAHEITHGLIVERIGFVDSVRAPAWVSEGYCDYVAREGSFPEQQGRALVAQGRGDPSASFKYFVSRLMVTYLIEEKKMTFEQVAASAIASDALHASTAAEMARLNRPAVQ